MREIALDTETTGLDPAQGHRVVEIGAVEMVNQIATGATFHALINPEREVPDDAVRIHGHSTASLAGQPTFAAIVDEFLAFIGEARLVIHNAEFDLKFINAELERARARRRSRPNGCSTRWRWRVASTPAGPTTSTRCATAIASIARGGSGTGRCSTRKSWSTSTAN